MFNFQIQHQEQHCLARTGTLTTSHGTIKTPAFVPVATQASVKALTPEQITEMGFDCLLANTYHLYLQPGAELIARKGGLHQFMSWNKPLFTDSGGFQVFSLNGELCKVDDDGVDFRSFIDCSKHRFTPEISMQVQHQLGADMIFAFDECLAIEADYETTKKSMERTHQWAIRSLNEFKKLNVDQKQALYGIVQGGRFLELREESAKFISSLDFQGIGIGSIFGDPKEESRKIIEHTVKFLSPEKPKHMLGIGAVDDIFNYVELGADTFDCVLPTRLARVGYIFIRPESGGTVQNKFRYRLTNAKFKESDEPLDKNCGCYVCQNYSNAYLHHLFKAKELLFYTLTSYHNLFFFARLMKEMRTAIEGDRFLEMKAEWLG